jgi:N-acetylmuramoyl-L-alanine amidase
MRKILFYLCFAGLNFLTLLLSGFSEALTLPELVKKLDATLEWEPLSDFGSITKGELWVNFKLGSPYLLLGNEQLIRTEPVIMQKDGTITFSAAAVASLTAYFAPSTYTLTAPKISVILIDPGHGGKDPGAMGKYTDNKITHPLKEKDLVLLVSQHLRDLIRQGYPDKQVLLTRDTDTYLSLEERIEKANAIKVGKTESIIFISIHANASFSTAARGFEVWYLPPQYKRNLIGSEDVEAQNRDLIPILNTMLDAEYTTESILLAKNILTGIDEKIGRQSPNRGLKAEKWFVVHHSKMPSVLIELGFVTNPEEASRLATTAYLHALALGIYNGLNVFIRNFENSKPFAE